MNRIRLAFAALAFVLAIPMGLVAHRAVRSIEAESLAHHDAVAERIFDEMERELSKLLEEEDARPVGHYRPVFASAGVLGAKEAWARSPLATLPEAPHILGYFQVELDGTFTTPYDDKAPDSDQRPSGTIARLRDVVGTAWKLGEKQETPTPAPTPRPQPVAKYVQSPGTTVALKSALPRGARNEDVAQSQMLNYLNRGAGDRAQRSRKLQKVPAANVYNSLPSLKEPTVQQQPKVRPKRPTVPARRPEPVEAGPGDEVTVDLFPMTAQSVGDGRWLMLYRIVAVGGRGYRQGVVLDVSRLTQWLVTRTLEAEAIRDFVSVSFAEGAEGSSPYIYRRRFAEPFGALAATLTLEELPDAPVADFVYLMAALMALVGGVALLALFRMVSVTVRYAERRSNFVSSVTHELKTPLTSIRMYSEMLQEGMVASEDKRQSYYQTITRETERLSRLINNVLELSRLEKGTRDVKISVGDVGPVLGEVASTLGPPAKEAGFEICVEAEPDLPAVRFERDALLQVVFNLVDNAIKYAKDAEDRRIILSAKRTGECVEVTVRDFGPGVPLTQSSHVFEPFYRGQSELTRTEKGTGIGLALVKGLAEGMGAQLRSTNPSGGGFEVGVALPVA